MSVMNNETFNKLMENEAFVKEMLSQESEEAVQALYARNGVELTMEEVQEIGKTLSSFDTDGELDEANLDDVAGGVVFTTWAVARTAVAVGALGYAAYKWYKKRR